jgi:hypothetical protein
VVDLCLLSGSMLCRTLSLMHCMACAFMRFGVGLGSSFLKLAGALWRQFALATLLATVNTNSPTLLRQPAFLCALVQLKAAVVLSLGLLPWVLSPLCFLACTAPASNAAASVPSWPMGSQPMGCLALCSAWLLLGTGRLSREVRPLHLPEGGCGAPWQCHCAGCHCYQLWLGAGGSCYGRWLGLEGPHPLRASNA